MGLGVDPLGDEARGELSKLLHESRVAQKHVAMSHTRSMNGEGLGLEPGLVAAAAYNGGDNGHPNGYWSGDDNGGSDMTLTHLLQSFFQGARLRRICALCQCILRCAIRIILSRGLAPGLVRLRRRRRRGSTRTRRGLCQRSSELTHPCGQRGILRLGF